MLPRTAPPRTALLLGLAVALAAIGLWLGLAPPRQSKPAAMAIVPVVQPPAPAEPSRPAAPPAAPALPPLPAVDVASIPERAPPPEPAAPEGRPLDLRNFEAGPAPAAPVRAATSASPGNATGPGRAPRDFAGPARVTGATGLIVGRIPVELFGVARSAAGDRCGGTGCEEAAMAALQARLSAGRVSCHSPKPNLGVVAFAVCLDGNGVDLGGMLVGDGLARANRRESTDYVGAERVARDLRHGLWQSR